MTEQARPIVGIDLGTTMSAVGIMRDGRVRFFENALGETLTPSVVAHDTRSGGMVVGRTAKDILAVHPSLGAAAFKRLMGADDALAIDGKRYSPVQLSAYVLDALRQDAERALGGVVDRCVVTVPAYFGEAQRHATKQAAEMVGFKVERVLNEPTAAAIAYGLHEGADESQFAVLDLGGGTFDVCVMELFDGLLEVKGVSGVSQLGGEDFTHALRELALRLSGLELSQLDARARTLLSKRAELLKRKLGRWASSEIRVPTGQGDEEVTVTVTASDASDAYAPLLERLVAPCRAALRGAGISPDELDDVILVGGATRMPCIASFAETLFGRPARQREDPDHLVAEGAAIQAALCAKDASVGDMVVTDVASHSLGIGVVRRLGGRVEDGYFSPLIDRNTVIPTSRAEVFGTVQRDQTSLTVEVFEGEGRRVADNRKLGEFDVKGIPKGDPRDAVKVRFTYDSSGILEVEATVIETGAKAARIFQRSAGELSEAQLESARAEIARLKADPKERPRHRDLLARAAALWSEVSGEAREVLAMGIDDFEVALDSRNPKEMEHSYQRLLSLCAGIDQGERW